MIEDYAFKALCFLIVGGLFLVFNPKTYDVPDPFESPFDIFDS